MSNPTLSITVTNENGLQLKLRTSLNELLFMNPFLNKAEILEQLAEYGEAWIQSGTTAKQVSPESRPLEGPLQTAPLEGPSIGHLSSNPF